MPDDPTSPKEPTLFAEASLVSRSPKRESSKLKTTPDISGRKCLELSGNSGPLGCVEKMLLDSCDWAWTKYSLTWKAKATPRGRLIFQLARQAHPTSDNDYGLLHTPTAKANQTSPSMVERGHGNWVSNLWPTPRATSRMAYHESPTKSQIEGTHGWNLNAAVTDSLADDPARLWPTPNVQDLNKATKKWREDHQNNLTAAVFNPEKMWPTPSAQEPGWKNIEVVDKDGNTPTHHNQRFYDKKTRRLVQKGLSQVVVGPKTTGHLNPKWVAWLMGYPIEYLSCVPWGTQSSRKSRKE
jgi:hypothetical protein